MTLTTKRDLFERELGKLYHAEHEILELHADLADAATSDEVCDLFSGHREDTITQIHRIEAIFEAIDADPEQHGSSLMEGLLAEKDEFVSDVRNDDLHDIGVIRIGTLNERIEITVLDELLLLAAELDFPGEVTEHLDANRSEASDALSGMQTFFERERTTR
jgi:ferritin-like metal-binding protein YciE